VSISDDTGQPAGHPFVVQLDWLLAEVGGKEKLAALSGVSVRTLGNWSAGRVPEKSVTSAVRALDGWAARNLPGYPAEAGVPRLVDSCGPRTAREVVPVDAGTTAPDGSGADGSGTDGTGADGTRDRGAAAGPRSRAAGPRRRWLVAGPVVAALLGAGIALVVEHARDEPSTAASTQPLPELPTSASEPPRDELTGSIGANAFRDPRTLADRAPMIPPSTTVSVRCRFYAPSIPSVEPDGYWYLIDSGEWAGLWSPANSYMNGDVPGGPYTHNTDFEVPECR